MVKIGTIDLPKFLHGKKVRKRKNRTVLWNPQTEKIQVDGIKICDCKKVKKAPGKVISWAIKVRAYFKEADCFCGQCKAKTYKRQHFYKKRNSQKAA